jgi:hypothetical protein
MGNFRYKYPPIDPMTPSNFSEEWASDSCRRSRGGLGTDVPRPHCFGGALDCAESAVCSRYWRVGGLSANLGQLCP